MFKRKQRAQFGRTMANGSRKHQRALKDLRVFKQNCAKRGVKPLPAIFRLMLRSVFFPCAYAVFSMWCCRLMVTNVGNAQVPWSTCQDTVGGRQGDTFGPAHHHASCAVHHHRIYVSTSIFIGVPVCSNIGREAWSCQDEPQEGHGKEGPRCKTGPDRANSDRAAACTDVVSR